MIVVNNKKRQSRRYAENHVTRQFFEASSRHEDFSEKTKNPFLDLVNGRVWAKFQVCIVFRLARGRDTNKYIHKYTSEIRNILHLLLASRGF